ncbi:PDPK1 [Bugula neritina]|uniref:PDPK1 n=1 Tax=Bugula neritina TaxID=10212 RepID=A0A7J7JXQ3_BUGNE|nr:PDPK1 [Bugula neritina]
MPHSLCLTCDILRNILTTLLVTSRICSEYPQLSLSKEEKALLLNQQALENDYHKFVENNLIVHQGLLDKRKGLFARRRMFLMTEGPHLYYVDPVNMVLKGEVPWSRTVRPESKNFKVFFMHTPKRTYYLEDPAGTGKSGAVKLSSCGNITTGLVSPS